MLLSCWGSLYNPTIYQLCWWEVRIRSTDDAIFRYAFSTRSDVLVVEFPCQFRERIPAIDAFDLFMKNGCRRRACVGTQRDFSRIYAAVYLKAYYVFLIIYMYIESILQPLKNHNKNNFSCRDADDAQQRPHNIQLKYKIQSFIERTINNYKAHQNNCISLALIIVAFIWFLMYNPLWHYMAAAVSKDNSLHSKYKFCVTKHYLSIWSDKYANHHAPSIWLIG